MRRRWCSSPVDCRRVTGIWRAARDRAARAIERLVPYAHELGVNLGIEPMNPIYAADRGVISTLGAGAGHRRALRRRRRRRGGRHVSPVVGTRRCRPAAARRRTHCQLPDLRLDHPAAGGHPAGSRHDGRRPHRLPCLHQIRRAGGLSRRHRGGDLQRRSVGGATGARSWTRW